MAITINVNGSSTAWTRRPKAGAAISNAIANATGMRLRDLPFTRERIKAALA